MVLWHNRKHYENNGELNELTKQSPKKILIAGIVIILVCCLFPPWICTYKAESRYSENPAGYALIISPPDPESSNRFGIKLDTSRLLLQLFIVFIATGAGVLIFEDKGKKAIRGSNLPPLSSNENTEEKGETLPSVQQREPARTKEETEKWASDFIKSVAERVERERTNREIARKGLTGESARLAEEKAKTDFEENNKILVDDTKSEEK